MIAIENLRAQKEYRVISLGIHPGIIQSMLDYDYMIGRKKPSIIAIIASGRRQERFFWGEEEVIIPVYSGLEKIDAATLKKCNGILNVLSARRVFTAMQAALAVLPNVKVATIFAEQTPERHAQELKKLAPKRGILLTGPSSVGVLLPGIVKLGAIGGTQHPQISAAGIFSAGDTAVISTSGGTVNELIHTVTKSGLGVSFAVALGGDRYPVTSPAEAMLLAEQDPQTKRIVYFGELGGKDEYEIAELIKAKQLKKKIVAYIAGTVADLFETPPQFGHAKAMAKNQDESAAAKKEILRKRGVVVCDTFGDISVELGKFKDPSFKRVDANIGKRRKSLIVSHISGDKNDETQLLGDELLNTVESNSIASLTLSLLLGQKVTSRRAIEFTDHILRLLVDHGPYVSGALNTIVAARAGKDLVSSLAAGMLTIGPRFGGAINASAGNWLEGATMNEEASAFVERFARKGEAIPGIGHKKYRTEQPDPRVESLMKFTGNKNGDRYLKFARSVELVTTAKKDILILNVDGAIGAVLLDILESELGYSEQQLRELVDIEFFNAVFVLSRSIGFTAHYLDQRRHDEGLLRLSDHDVRYIGGEN